MSMTTDKAIEILETTLYGSPEDVEKYGAFEHAEATREAIKALKREPCIDAVSREEAVTVLRADPLFICTGDKGVAITDILSLPPVIPERPKGKWEEYGHNLGDDYIPVGIRCSKCHTEPPKRDPHKDKSFMNYIKSDFCPKCGADMRGVSECSEENKNE